MLAYIAVRLSILARLKSFYCCCSSLRLRSCHGRIVRCEGVVKILHKLDACICSFIDVLMFPSDGNRIKIELRG